MELWTGALSWWKCYWPDLKSAGLFRRNLFLNSLANQLWCIYFLTPPTPLIIPPRLPAFFESLMPLKNWCSTHAKAVWSIPYVSVALFPTLKQNFITYRSYKVSDCIFEIHQLWQLGFSRVYSNYCCSCSFEPEIIKIDQSSHNMYSNNILNFQEYTTILNVHPKKVWKLIVCPLYIFITKSYSHSSSMYIHSLLWLSNMSIQHTQPTRLFIYFSKFSKFKTEFYWISFF